MGTSLTKPTEDQFAVTLASLQSQAQNIAVKTPDDCLTAKTMQQHVRRYLKDVHAKLDPFVQVAKNAYDDAKAHRERWLAPGEQVDEVLAGKVKAFEREEREAAQREQDRINAENRRLAQEKAEAERKQREKEAKEKREARVKEINAALKAGTIGKREAIKLLKEAGAHEAAAIEQAAFDAEAAAKAPPPEVTVKPNIPTVAGVPSRVNYKAEVSHPNQLINAFVDACSLRNTERALYLRRFIMPNDQELGAEARKVKDSKKLAAEIPGVRFYEE